MAVNRILIRKSLSIIVGCTFLLSGLGKLPNIVAFQRLLLDYGLGAFHIAAPFVVLVEILLGTMLLLQLYTKEVSVLSICLLVLFTLVFTYAWRIHGITNCGCFGNVLPVSTSPAFTYVRNLVLIAMLVYVALTAHWHVGLAHWKVVTLATTMLAATFVSGMSYHPRAFRQQQQPYEKQCLSDTPLAEYATAEASQSELLLFFSYKCPHCISSLENFRLWRTLGAVDKITAVAVTDSATIAADSMRLWVLEYYKDLSLTEINEDEADMVDVYPTAFYMRNDTVQKVLVGSLPSPALFMDSWAKELKYVNKNATSSGLFNNN